MSKSLAIVVAMVVASPSMAIAGPYVGFGIGGTRTEATLQDLGLYPPLQIPTPGDPQFLLPEYKGGQDFSSTDVAFDIAAGWMFGSYFGVEVGYTDFGNATQNYQLPDSCNSFGCNSREWTAQMKTTGVRAFLIGSLPISKNVDAYAKLGAIRRSTDYSGFERNVSFAPGPPIGIRNSPVRFDDDGTDLAGAVGLNLKIESPFSLRAEVAYFDLNRTDLVWNAQLMLIYGF